MHRDNRCMHMAHVFMFIVLVVTVTVSVGVCGNFCCIAAVKDCGLFEPWSVKVCCMFV